MSEGAWLAIAVIAGTLFAWVFVKRELWIHRRRARRGPPSPPRS